MIPVTPGQGWRLSVQHTTGYRYSKEVAASYNEARLSPRTTPRQLPLGTRVTTSPAGRPIRYVDYWGNQVVAFDVHIPHTELTVTSSAVVETSPPPLAPPEPVSSAVLRDSGATDPFTEYLMPTAQTPTHPVLEEVARALAAQHDPVDMVVAAGNWVGETMTYRPGATAVHTSAVEGWEVGEGVCQDFAHVGLVLLRAAGVPARYVSGYLHPQPDAPVGQVVTGESHAWVEAWVGDWVDYDPTAGDVPGERHVVVGYGRDYADVSPLRGIYSGGLVASLGVTVEVTRLA